LQSACSPHFAQLGKEFDASQMFYKTAAGDGGNVARVAEARP
jgi:hypothetical protein